jgi:solute carrier family 50 protein (sugar transporter)
MLPLLCRSGLRSAHLVRASVGALRAVSALPPRAQTQALPQAPRPARALVLGSVPVDVLIANWKRDAEEEAAARSRGRLGTSPFAHFGGGLAAGSMMVAASPSESWLSPGITWWLESCVGFNGISLGLPGLAAQVMFLAPMQAMSQIKAAGTTSKLPLLPYTAMMASGFVWAAYGLLLNNPAIWLPNIPALVLGAYYSYTFAKFAPAGANWLPSTKGVHAVGVAAIFAGTTAAALTLDTATAVNALGILGDGIVIAMFGGPLIAIKTVLSEKSTRSLPFAFTIASFVNCALWSTYGIAVIHDPYIWIPNVLGLASSIAQLGLFARFGFK